jgi:hypothetical protein
MRGPCAKTPRSSSARLPLSLRHWAELGVGMDTEAALRRLSKQSHVLPRLAVKEPEFLLAAYKRFVSTDNDPLLEHVAAVIKAVRFARASW